MKRYVIQGNPVPQGRARSFINRKSGKIGHYDPSESVSWKNMVAWQVQNQHPEMITQGPVFIKAVFRLKRPVSLPQRVVFHTKKPDVDNLVKAVKDALKGLCWTDDAQVVKLLAVKVYALTSGSECVELEIGGEADSNYFT